MNVNGIGVPAASQGQTGKTANKTGADLDINDFFKLISAQMKNQSMFDTVDNAQFMAQMVQFSTLSQMTELTNAYKSGYAVSLIGKQVSLSSIAQDGSQQVQVGKVDQVNFNGGVPYILVNGEYHQISEVMDVAQQIDNTPQE